MGTFARSLDPKKRLTIPSVWRAALGPDLVYVVPDPRRRCLQLVPRDVMEAKLAKYQELALGDAEINDALDAISAASEMLEFDVQGRIRINGRKKEIIIRGGENISAVEVDNALSGCPGVGDHATIGMPDLRMGERICTFMVPQGTDRPTIASVTAYLADAGIPKRIWPEHLEFINEIPYTPTGKVQRYKLMEELLRRLKKEA